MSIAEGSTEAAGGTAAPAPQEQWEAPVVAGPAPLGTSRAQRYAEEPPQEGSMYPGVHELLRPHLDSFNALFDAQEGQLALAVAGLDRREVRDALGNRLTFALEEVTLAPPLAPEREGGRRAGQPVLPRECRERGTTYRGQLTGRIVWQVNDGPRQEERRALGHLPVMVRGARCHLQGLGAAELVAHGEDADEPGGYFIVNGNERLVRLLVAPRRNHVLALVRPSFARRGPLYTPFGCQVRSVRADGTSHTNYLQYRADGTCMVRFALRKQEFLLPAVLVLRALTGAADQDIMEAVLQGAHDNTFVAGRVEAMLRDFRRAGALHTRDACLAHLGARFHVALAHLPRDTAPVDVGRHLLQRVLLVHLDAADDKFNLLVLMLRKLYALVAGQCAPDNPDAPMQQELLLSGQLLGACLKEKLDDALQQVQAAVAADVRRAPTTATFAGRECAPLRRALARTNTDVGRRIEYFLATGNLVSPTGLDQQQTSGWTVVAERLNYLRFLAHFRSVHRGAFFAELKTTAVRKLAPEAWGFLCPVHTPDGAPCGLLNHLAHACRVPHAPAPPAAVRALTEAALALGVVPLARAAQRRAPAHLPVLVDGRWVGLVAPDALAHVAAQLRHLRAHGAVPPLAEIAAIPPSRAGLFPGLYVWTGPCRMMRPVAYLPGPAPSDHIGTLEQVFLDVAVRPADVVPGRHRYCEQAPTNIFSVVANMTPFCDFNQSPRNMYQCQMAKQSMGTPTHAWACRTDNKLYRLQSAQRPLVRPRLYARYGLDDFPNGTNAVVAVISYTGYDMEDAMILNKSAFERGFKHGSIYKTDFVDIADRSPRGESRTHHFGVRVGERVGAEGAEGASASAGSAEPGAHAAAQPLTTIPPTTSPPIKGLDWDGLPQPGTIIRPDDPLFAVVDEATGTVRIERFKAFEPAIIDQVRLIGGGAAEGTAGSNGPCQRVCIKFRVPRNPVIGDKFASRAGQKGVCSQKYPLVDLPFTESGIAPDIIINPHAFPSRMTIGMFVESMAAKAGAMHGLAQDAAPFQFSETHSAADYFGEQLRAAGFNYYGNEPMYSGITGHELRVDIFIGVVYYQRLRHMVSDKFQVRTTGPVHNLTQQPVKGRKRAGGIRFGEMERDSLLAHGVAFTLQDRLLNCSDYSKALVCTACGSILAPVPSVDPGAVRCQSCTPRGPAAAAAAPAASIRTIALPFVFRYLASELLAMNINMRLQVD